MLLISCSSIRSTYALSGNNFDNESTIAEDDAHTRVFPSRSSAASREIARRTRYSVLTSTTLPTSQGSCLLSLIFSLFSLILSLYVARGMDRVRVVGRGQRNGHGKRRKQRRHTLHQQ